MNWANIGKNFISKFTEQPRAESKTPDLEQTAIKSITSPSKTVERSLNSKSPTTNGEKSLTAYLRRAGAIYEEVSSRAGVLESFKDPLKPLENKQIKLRLGADGKLTAKNRSRIAITSRIGGAKSQEAVKHLLAQLETASKLPNDPNNPQSVVKHLDDLLNNEWFSKTIANDKSGELKSQVLDILANEMITSPGTDHQPILTKLKSNTSELNAKLSNPSERKEAVLNTLEAMNVEPDINTLKNLTNMMNKAYLNKTIAEDPAVYKETILSIMTNVVVGYPTIQAADLNLILSPLSGGNPETLVNEFEEGLMDYAYNLAETLRRENTDSFADAYNNVQTDVGQDVQNSFLESYHNLLEVIIQRK